VPRPGPDRATCSSATWAGSRPRSRSSASPPCAARTPCGGPSLPSLRRRLHHLDPVFTGPLHGDELADAYAALDVFVHTGTTETFGQTVQEAHAAGVPVVAPAAGGPLDLVRHGVDGYLFDPRHDHSLRRSVGTLVADPALRARFGEAGRRAVVGRTWESVGDALLDHYAAAGTAVRQAAAARAATTDDLLSTSK
jgi:phosphatidylinositol alpha 1,6-mannosyltransferase